MLKQAAINVKGRPPFRNPGLVVKLPGSPAPRSYSRGVGLARKIWLNSTAGDRFYEGSEVGCMTIETWPVTAGELLRMPDDGFRYELVKGELRKMVPAGSEHGNVTLRIASRLERHAEEHKLGRVYAAETGFRISSNPDTVRPRCGLRGPRACREGGTRGGLLARRARPCG